QLERGLRTAEATRRVDARREAKTDRALVARCGVDAGDRHQRPQPGLLRLRQATQTGERQRPALVDEGNDVRDRGERDDVEMPVEEWVPRPEERLGELPHDSGATEAGE